MVPRGGGGGDKADLAEQRRAEEGCACVYDGGGGDKADLAEQGRAEEGCACVYDGGGGKADLAQQRRAEEGGALRPRGRVTERPPRWRARAQRPVGGYVGGM